MTSTRPQYRVRIFLSTVSYSIDNGYIKKVDILNLEKLERGMFCTSSRVALDRA